ncbi:MAG TPA: PAS domain S-box protein [Polyangiales bacterium]|nr:PAS domain S-box protein [Polyangiales bacterium]
MGRVLRVLWIAESADDATSITEALQSGGFAVTARRVQTATELQAALAEQRWDVLACSLRGSLPPAALVALDSVPSGARPPLILIADRFESAALEAYRWSALVCLRDRLFLQLTAAVENLLGEADGRAGERGEREFERGQREVLERIAAGAPLRGLLEQIVCLVEAQSEGMLCSILLLDERKLRHGAHSSLPREFIQKIDGAAIGPQAGSCGTAAYIGQRVIVEDIETDPLWADYRQIASPHGLRACWSSPIFSPQRDVLGTFAMYYRVARRPHPQEVAWVDRATHLASIAMCRDRAEQVLRRSEARYRQIVDTAHEGVWLTDANAHTLFLNRRCAELLGQSPEELFGRSLFEFVDPSSRAVARELWQNTQSANQQVEVQFRRKDGSQLWAMVAASALRDEQGNPAGMLAMLSDTTELRKAEFTLRQRQRMESLGTLAGGIAHDFNNILTAIAHNLSLAVSDLPEKHVVQDALAEIDVAVKRATDLVRQILTFSRHQESKREQLRLEVVVDEALQMLKATLPGSVQIETKYAPDLPEILADPTQLHQVVMNLGTNAAHAMAANGGRLAVRAGLVTERSRKTAGATELRAGSYVKLEVSDTGTGMDVSTLERIFDPFFTTREPGAGTGLGLSVVHGIVKSHEGAIEVRSTPASGSCFTIYLPAAARAQVEPPRPSRIEFARGEGERILCIDDEAAVVRVATQVLRRLGYQPTGHTDAVQALEAFRADPNAFDLLLTDFAMPHLTGHALVAAFQRVRPGLPIVVTSGRIDNQDVEALRAVGIREVLFKPSSVAELGASLRRALRDRR